MADRPLAVVTGASRGIGRSIAIRLAADGYDIVGLYGKDDAAARETEALVAAGGGAAALFRVDLRQPGAVAGGLGEWVGDSPVKVVVANAASSAFKPVSALRQHHHDQTLQITVMTFIDLIAGLGSNLAEGGCVVAVSGWDSSRVLPGHGLLGAAKAALEVLVRYLAVELAPRGVRAVGVSPGPVSTDSMAFYLEHAHPDVVEHWERLRLQEQYTTPEEIGNVVAFLVSGEANAINGQTIVADAGISILGAPGRLRETAGMPFGGAGSTGTRRR